MLKSNQLLAADYSFVNHETSQTTRFEGDRQLAPYLTVLLTSISTNHIISAQLHLRVAIQDHEANLRDILGLSCLEESKSEMINQQ